jgi:hypothetical protein
MCALSCRLPAPYQNALKFSAIESCECKLSIGLLLAQFRFVAAKRQLLEHSPRPFSILIFMSRFHAFYSGVCQHLLTTGKRKGACCLKPIPFKAHTGIHQCLLLLASASHSLTVVLFWCDLLVYVCHVFLQIDASI